jgi:hypothetical protein
MAKVLFILKRREDFDPTKHSTPMMSTGLYNSAKFMHDMLLEKNVKTDMSVVVDNNEIDREVTKHRPTHVIIEAIWVVPSKFAVLQKLHPKVKWIIRLHSEMSFLANEGNAIDWICDYSMFKNIIIAANAFRTYEQMSDLLKIRNGWSDKVTHEKVIYLPNYFPMKAIPPFKKYENRSIIDVACFGAIRPLKNQLLQAIAAVKFADTIGKKLVFHINSGRIENQGAPVNRNLTSMFQHLYDSGHRLINHEWRPRDKFLELCKRMDIGLQVSFSETFNIVAADLISVGVPVIGSKEIPWLLPPFCANPNDSEDMVKKMLNVYENSNKAIIHHQSEKLIQYGERSSDIWYSYFN